MNAFDALDRLQQAMEEQATLDALQPRFEKAISDEIKQQICGFLSGRWSTEVTIDTSVVGKNRKDVIASFNHAHNMMKARHNAELDIGKAHIHDIIDMLIKEDGKVGDLVVIFEGHMSIPPHAEPLPDTDIDQGITRLQKVVFESIRDIREIDEMGTDVKITLETPCMFGIQNIRRARQQCRLDIVDVISDLIDEMGFPDISGEVVPDEVMSGSMNDLIQWLFLRYHEYMDAA